MTPRGRPPIGKVREFVIPDDLYDRLRGEARQLGISYAELLRRILTERYALSTLRPQSGAGTPRDTSSPTIR